MATVEAVRRDPLAALAEVDHPALERLAADARGLLNEADSRN